MSDQKHENGDEYLMFQSVCDKKRHLASLVSKTTMTDLEPQNDYEEIISSPESDKKRLFEESSEVTAATVKTPRVEIAETPRPEIAAGGANIHTAEVASGGADIHISDLPAEIFQHILRYLTFDNIAKIRPVSQRSSFASNVFSVLISCFKYTYS